MEKKHKKRCESCGKFIPTTYKNDCVNCIIIYTDAVALIESYTAMLSKKNAELFLRDGIHK